MIYKDTGNAATSPLIAYIDLTTPVTPNGGDINITWNASGILQSEVGHGKETERLYAVW